MMRIKDMIINVKRMFGIYNPMYEYLVRLNDIKVPYCYKHSRIKQWKWDKKVAYWLKTGEFESNILLHKDFTLADGYSSVKIAYLNGIEKVPVYFVD